MKSFIAFPSLRNSGFEAKDKLIFLFLIFFNSISSRYLLVPRGTVDFVTISESLERFSARESITLLKFLRSDFPVPSSGVSTQIK